MPRLDQLLAQRAGLTRTQARAAIRRGLVRVDGAPTRSHGLKVEEGVTLELQGEAFPAPPRVALFHKPAGVQSTVGDPWARPSLAEAARELLAMGLHPVGRLDADTDGLLLFSGDGSLTQRLLHPKRGVPKVYLAEVEGQPGEALVRALEAGVETAEGVHVAEVIGITENRITLSVTEGKHRMVRRMLANAGHPVLSLRRLRFGGVELGELAPGAWRAASPDELEVLSGA